MELLVGEHPCGLNVNGHHSAKTWNKAFFSMKKSSDRGLSLLLQLE